MKCNSVLARGWASLCSAGPAVGRVRPRRQRKKDEIEHLDKKHKGNEAIKARWADAEELEDPWAEEAVAVALVQAKFDKLFGNMVTSFGRCEEAGATPLRGMCRLLAAVSHRGVRFELAVLEAVFESEDYRQLMDDAAKNQTAWNLENTDVEAEVIPGPPGEKAKKAKHQTAWNAENSGFDAKGLVGQKFVEPFVRPIVPQKARPKARVRLRFVGWPDD